MGFSWKKTLGVVVNPINAALDSRGLGAMSAIDDFTGKSASEAAARSAAEAQALQLRLHNENIALQKEFAQHGLRWRVEDAKAAGLHPLAALGASGASFSPSIPMIDPLPSGKEWRHRLGQNIQGHIINRVSPINRVMEGLAVERAGLENDLLKLQIANEAKGQGGSADAYLQGQPDSLKGDPSVVDVPLRRVVSDPNDPSKEAGAIQDWQIVRSQNGYAVVPAQGVKQAIEDSPMEYQWLARAATRTYRHPKTGEEMRMNPFTGELYKSKNFWSRAGEVMWGKGGFRGWKDRVRGRQ